MMNKFELVNLVSIATELGYIFRVDEQGNINVKEFVKPDQELNFSNETKFEEWLYERFNLDNGTEIIDIEN
jgi:hypothetical protein